MRSRFESTNTLDRLPLILHLNKGGEPVRWINYRKSAEFYAKDKVLWSLGQHEVVLKGGTNARTGERSIFVMDTIIAVDDDCNKSPSKFRTGVPKLSNRALFARDRNICGYCANEFVKKELTRDHIVPKSRDGKDTWTNLVTACKVCNHKKGNRTPKEARMPLVYVPYVPNFNESLILQNRNILADQMDYLIKGVSRDSRLHKMIEDGLLLN